MIKLDAGDLARAASVLALSNIREVFAEGMVFAEEMYAISLEDDMTEQQGETLMFAGMDRALSRLTPDQIQTIAVLALMGLAKERANRR